MLNVPSYMKFNEKLHTGLFESNINFHKRLTNETEAGNDNYNHKSSDLLKGQQLHKMII